MTLKSCLSPLAGLGIAVALLVFVMPVQTVHAQGASSYVSPFATAGKRYSVFVFGSSLADGLFYGMNELAADKSEVKLVSKARGGTSLMRSQRFDWVGDIQRQIERGKPDIAVLLFGIGDRGVFFPAKGSTEIADLSRKRTDYAQRFDGVLELLKAKGIATYVVGNPIMRGPKTRGAMRVINDVLRQRSFRAGFKYIDQWSTFAGDSGEYVSHGPDLEGRVRRLRSEDGVYFTGSGYRKMAHPVFQEILRDIKIAKADRKVPLAGDLSEQRSLKPRPVGEGDTTSSPSKAKKKPTKVRTRNAARRLTRNALEQKPDHSEIVLRIVDGSGKAREKKVKIYRPAIPAAVISHVIRTSKRNPDNKIGDQVRGSLGDRLTAISTIAPVNSIGVAGKLQTPLTQTPYYRVLVKGETPLSKRGRADDFSWRSPATVGEGEALKPDGEKKPSS